MDWHKLRGVRHLDSTELKVYQYEGMIRVQIKDKSGTNIYACLNKEAAQTFAELLLETCGELPKRAGDPDAA